MKKYFIITIIIFSLFIMNVKGASSDTLSVGPVTWYDYYYTKVDNETGHKSFSYMQMFVRNSDNTAVYCIEPGVLISFDEAYFGYDYNQASFANISQAVFEKISLIAYFGYGYKDAYYNHSDYIWWAVTQWMIWQEANNNHTIYFTQNQNYSGNEPPIERFTQEIAQINALINDYYTKPAISIPTLILGQTLEINDTNNVLHNYHVKGCRNCHASIDNNKLIITATETGNSQVSLERNFDKYNSDPIVYVSTSYQNVMAAGSIKNIKIGIGYFTTAGNMTMQKNDADNMNNNSQGDAELSNAVYAIYNTNGQKITELTTNSQGIATAGKIPIGSYYLKEIASSKGYTLDTKKYYFNINSNNLNIYIDVYEKVIEKNVDIFKVKANSSTSILEPEPGITFEFYLQSTNELIKSIETDNDGKLSVTLPYGTYTVHQVNSSEGCEKIENFTIIIDNNSPDTIYKVIANSSLSARVKLIKVDEETNQPINLSGIKFKIKNLDTDQYVCQYISYPNKKEVCVFKTNEEGVFITPYPLEYGTYQIEELEQDISGYIVNTNPVIFTIDEESAYYDENLGLIVEIMFGNKKEPVIIEEQELPVEEIVPEEPIIEDIISVDVPNTINNNYSETIILFLLIIYGVGYVKEKEY